MSPIVPSRYGHPKYNIIPQKSRSASQGGVKSTSRNAPSAESKYSRRKQRLEESKITVQSAEDEDTDNFFSKHLAAARFHRNHRLINIILSDTVVEQEPAPDNEKLQAFKKRIKSLTDHQSKIDSEIVELDEKFQAKKAKILDESKSFSLKLSNFVFESKQQVERAKLEKVKYDQEQEKINLQQQIYHKEKQRQQQLEDSAKKLTEANNVSSKKSKNDSVIPMEISYDECTNVGATNNKSDNLYSVVSQCLMKLIDSVANST